MRMKWSKKWSIQKDGPCGPYKEPGHPYFYFACHFLYIVPKGGKEEESPLLAKAT